MKKTVLLALSLLSLFTFFSCQDKPLELKVMTFNVRLDVASDSLNSWPYRKDVAAQIIKDYDIDIVGTQEVRPNQMQDLKDRLPEYSAIGVGRDDGANEGEHSALFYKKDKFKVLDSGTFWLSETPEKPGSMGWDAACPRIATWAVFEDIVTEKKVFAINTHLDHIGKEARINGVTMMLEKAVEVAKGYPVVLTGDFNSDPESDVVKHVTNESTPNSLVDSRTLAVSKKDAKGTFHGFGKVEPENREYIDYIFVSKEVEVENYEVIDDKLGDVYLSDHNPIWAKIKIK